MKPIFQDDNKLSSENGGANASAETISYATGECELGRLLIARSAKGICSILLGDTRDELIADLATRFPYAKLVEDEPALAEDLAKVIHLAEHPAEEVDLGLDARGTAFQRRVWEALRKIPGGSTKSYSELAKFLGVPGLARAVASACAANPIALVIPCHRVVRGNGELAGYRWGVERKRLLIQKEAAA